MFELVCANRFMFPSVFTAISAMCVELFQTTNSGHVLNGGFMFASLPMGAISKTHDSSMHTNTHIKYHVPITGVNGIIDRFI